METPLSAAVVGQLHERGVPLVAVGAEPSEGFWHSRPLPPRSRGPAAKPVQEKIDSVRSLLPDDVNRGIDNYVYSGDVTDLALQAQGYTELVARQPIDFDFDVFWDVFLRMAADLPLDENEDLAQIAVPDITVSSLMSQQQTSSSAGLLPLVTLFGLPSGNKDMQASATIVNERVLAHDGPPNSLPFKPTAKPEVIKRGKKVTRYRMEVKRTTMVMHIVELESQLRRERDKLRALQERLKNVEGTVALNDNGGKAETKRDDKARSVTSMGDGDGDYGSNI
ncbi:hypothetical protein ISCGN_023309 [Ixodes scapularis]